ncbi:MAG: endonuclease/exonuclease/phosphatase family protein [Prevotellaceae bacterium]|jgi:endonuclease/exonuclease/phosphatase family metal-dependent hydrolase|nr:endonuclease/exonuclease/phosphatase family protein [Prevotellaceae bacterium]
MKNIAKIFLFILKITAILNATALLMSITACYINPSTYWIFQLFGLFFPVIFTVNIIAVIILVAIKSKVAYFNLAIFIISVFFAGRFFQFSGNKTDSENAVKVISYNVHDFKSIDNYYKTTYDEIADFLLAEDADIICLQEYVLNSNELNKYKILQKLYQKYKYTSDNYGGQKIFSKYPFEKKQKFNLAGACIVFADININGKTVRTYSCHLQSTRFNPDGTQQRLTSKNANYKKELKRVAVNLRDAFIKRSKQIELIAAEISKSKYPAIVCGDFNDTPMSYSYQKIKGKMKDTFIEAGSGMSNTYKKLFSFLRIDYIFIDKNISTLEYRVAKEIKYSDHYPVIVKFKINDEK